VNDYNPKDPKTYAAGTFRKTLLDLPKMSGADFFKYWGLADTTIEFVGHALALYRDESFMDGPASDLVEKIQLYATSLMRFANMTSPYIYPLYGLGELPQAFARLAAVHGGLYMLNHEGHLHDVEVVYEGGVAVGVSAEGVTARAKMVIGDPSYFPDKVQKTGQVVRAIAIMAHPIAGSNDSGSCQIIFPQGAIKRKNDIYMFCISGGHKVAPTDGKYICFASTTVEGKTDGLTAQKIAERELAAALPLIHPALEIFYDIYDEFDPVDDGTANKLFISKTYDATSHFETAITDVLDIYRRIMGKELVLTSGPKRE